jgi:hypothetical protein
MRNEISLESDPKIPSHSVLKIALKSLDLQLDSELRRYQQQQGKQANILSEEENFSLVYQPDSDPEGYLTASVIYPTLSENEEDKRVKYLSSLDAEFPRLEREKTWIENLLTPWGISALLMILVANSLLAWKQVFQTQPVEPMPNSSSIPLLKQ